jgi:regulator of cell morphogenesis and NO signaling
MLDAQTPVARAVLDHSECASVFHRHHIDYCCNGKRSIAAACEARGLDQAAVLAELQQAISARGGGGGPDAAALSTPALVAHIVATHHAYLRRTLPFVRTLAAKVSRVHGERTPRLVHLEVLVGELADVLEPHLDEEEQVLFPALTARGADAAAVAGQLAAMYAEHLEVGSLLEQIRGTTDNYRAPEGACTSYRTLFSELDQLQRDIEVHVHLENHALLPRFAVPGV